MVTTLSIIQLVLAVSLIVIVSVQSGKKAGLSAALGGSDTFMSKNQSNSLDAQLAKVTKYIAFAFIILTFVLCLVQ